MPKMPSAPAATQFAMPPLHSMTASPSLLPGSTSNSSISAFTVPSGILNCAPSLTFCPRSDVVDMPPPSPKASFVRVPTPLAPSTSAPTPPIISLAAADLRDS